MEGRLTLRPKEGMARDPVFVPVAKGAAEVKVKLPANTQWEVTPEIRRFWALPSLVRVRSAEEETRYILGLWPKGTVGGSITVERGERLPAKLYLKVRSARLPGRQVDMPEVLVDCPVGEAGAWACEVPATLVDLSVRAEGFVPHHRFGMTVARDKRADLGRMLLKKGASLSGWIQVEAGTLEAGRASARLSPMVAPGAGLAMIEKVQSANVETQVDARGFFQFVGVAPGTYLVEVQMAGYAPAQAAPLEVWPGSETSLTEPLILKRPLRIALTVSPETDWLGKPWRVEVSRAMELNPGHNPGPVFEGPADAQGRIDLRGQAPGHFRVMVFDSLGNPMYSDFDVPILGPEDAERDIEIDLITVKGKVSLGDAPLSATLYFGGRHGATASRMESDEKGEFHGVLSRAGTWTVDIDAQEPRVSTLAQVSVEAERGDKAWISIVLPDTQVYGRVVDDQGKPVFQATVEALTEQGRVSIGTDVKGSFEFQAVPPGYLQVAAVLRSAGGRLESEPVMTFALEGQPSGPLELRLRKRKPFFGTVQGAHGPVPGAAVALSPSRPPLLFGDNARTDLSGEFQARLPELAEAVVAVVSPPGNSLKAFDLAVDGKPARLQVAADGGVLEISTGRSREEVRRQDLQMLVFQNNLPLPWGTLLSWAQGHGQRIDPDQGFRFPDLAPGEYRVCLVQRAELVRKASSEAVGLPGCASGYLEPGGTLRLTPGD